METLWTYQFEGSEKYDGEFHSKQAAEDHAFEFWSANVDDEGFSNGAEYETKVTLIAFYYNDDNEIVETNSEEATLEYTQYHGDYAEHAYYGV